MKCFLMYRDQDFELRYVGLYRGRDFEFELTRQLPANEGPLVQDLELQVLLDAMAGGNGFLLEVAKSAVLLGAPNDVETILYRQAILRDCLKNRSTRPRHVRARARGGGAGEKAVFRRIW